MNETSGSYVEMSVGNSMNCGFMVDWGLFVPAARLFAGSSSAPRAFVVAAFRCWVMILNANWCKRISVNLCAEVGRDLAEFDRYIEVNLRKGVELT